MKRINIILSVAFLLCILHTQVKAQLFEPVKWSYAAKKTGANEAVVFLKATLAEGWHIYSTTQPAGGPVKTTFKFSPAKAYVLNGKVTEPTPTTKYEDTFGLDVKYFDGSVIFQQKVKLRGGKPVVKGTITYMACDAKHCLPATDINFSIPVN